MSVSDSTARRIFGVQGWWDESVVVVNEGTPKLLLSVLDGLSMTPSGENLSHRLRVQLELTSLDSHELRKHFFFRKL